MLRSDGDASPPVSVSRVQGAKRAFESLELRIVRCGGQRKFTRGQMHPAKRPRQEEAIPAAQSPCGLVFHAEQNNPAVRASGDDQGSRFGDIKRSARPIRCDTGVAALCENLNQFPDRLPAAFGTGAPDRAQSHRLKKGGQPSTILAGADQRMQRASAAEVQGHVACDKKPIMPQGEKGGAIDYAQHGLAVLIRCYPQGRDPASDKSACQSREQKLPALQHVFTQRGRGGGGGRGGGHEPGRQEGGRGKGKKNRFPSAGRTHCPPVDACK